MKRLTRRGLLSKTTRLCLGALSACLLSACKQHVVEVEKVIEKEVTKIIKEVVRETVIVEGTPQVIERTVEKLVTVAPAPRPKVIVVADVMSYGWTQFAMLISPAFEELFPNVAMRWNAASDWSEYPKRIALLSASGQLGDLLESPPGALLARWAQKQVIRPLDDIIVADGFDTSGIFKSALRFSLYQDKQIGLPFLCHTGENVLLYHTGLFDKAKLPYPSADWTLNDLSKAAASLTRDQDGNGKTDQFGYDVRYDLPGAYPMLGLFGAYLFSQDSRRCLINSESGIACLRWAQEQIKVRKVAPSPAQLERGSLEMLRSGKLGMLRHNFRTLVDLRRSNKPEIDGVLFPKRPVTGKIGTLASGMVYCISQQSQVAREAFQWIKFMSSREMGVQMFLGGYADPGCRAASWKDVRILERFPLCAQVATAADTAEIERLPANLRISECLEAWNRRIAPLLFGEITPEECVQRIERDIVRILAQPPEEDGFAVPDIR